MDDLRPKFKNQGLIAASTRVITGLKFTLILLLILEVFLSCINIASSFDFPWQLSEGEFILDHGHPVKSVLHAYGEISPQFENEYILYEALIAGIKRTFGWTGICLFFGLLSFSIYLPCLLAFWKSRYQFSIIDICLFMLAQFLINMRLSARPELIADLCYVLTGIVLMSWPARSWSWKQTFAFGLIFFFWANAHGSFLLGGAMLGLWYLQLCIVEGRFLLTVGDFSWMKPGLAAVIGCVLNPFGVYRFTQPFELHGLLWGQGTSMEMWPVTSGVSLLPMTWTAASVLILAIRIRTRKYYWLIAMLFLLQYLTFTSIRYNIFIGLTLLIIAWDGLKYPRKPYVPTIFPLAFTVARFCVYLYLIIAFLLLSHSIIGAKVEMLRNYFQVIYPKSRIMITSSFKWLKEHPEQQYTIMGNLSSGSWSQMPDALGIHPLIDSGTHRYSDRTNQFYYYTLFSPDTFRLALDGLKINAITVNSANDYWAPILNADPNWRLVQVEFDSQLYLRRERRVADQDRPLFLAWEKEMQSRDLKDATPGEPIVYSSERILRGLKLRPDAESLEMLMSPADFFWVADPYIIYLQGWLAQVSDIDSNKALQILGGKIDNTSAALRILLSLRLGQNQQAVAIAHNWHPRIIDMFSQDMEMLRVEAFIRGGDTASARKILDSFWPKPRYSLRWARLCRQAYADDPKMMPKNALLLTELADQIKWQEDFISVLNQNIQRLSETAADASPK